MRRRPIPIALLSGVILLAAACGDEGGDGEPSAFDADTGGIRDRPDTSQGGSGADTTPTEVPDADSEGCENNLDCADENPCTFDFCESGTCTYVANNTTEPAQIPGNCQRETCEEGVLVLVDDEDDLPEDDGFECTTAHCDGGELVQVADDTFCDDGNRCNGTEVCSVDEGCKSGPPADLDGDGVADLDDPVPPDVDMDGITDCADWETCDGLDNDGDGLVDDDPQDDGLGEECYDGPEETADRGTCAPGLLACLAGEIVCLDQMLPAETEYCDGLDNDCDGVVPEEEMAAFCRTELTVAPDDQSTYVMRVEFPTELRLVDLHFNIDTTGSMSGALNTLRSSLRTEIVPSVAQVIPSVAMGVSTFEDYPLDGFGSGDDLPFELHQRITTRETAVQAALAEISLGMGSDIPESGIESLYQLATGAGTRWPSSTGGTSVDPAGLSGFVGEIDPPGDVDYFVVDSSGGVTFEAEVFASRAGSSLDSYIDLYDAGGVLLSSNDDGAGSLDSRLSYSLGAAGRYYLAVRGFSATYDRGFYYLQVTLNGLPFAPAESLCSNLEVGGDYFSGGGDAIELLPYSTVTPRDDPSACVADCADAIVSADATRWIASHCFAGGSSTCGDGVLDDTEECDDGDRVSGDGCSAICLLETEGVPSFNPDLGFDPGLGHGTRGGAGFREEALPIIVHATDAVSHHPDDYLAYDAGIEAHDVEDTFLELEKLGARIIGISTGTPASSGVSSLLNPPGMAFRTGSLVPPCAFDESEPRVAGRCSESQCCVGRNGAGQPPPSGADGMCVLSFDMGSDGAGLTDGVVRGIQALARFATYTLAPVFHDDPRNPKDARCFIHGVEIAEVIQPDECVPELELADQDGDGLQETLLNGTPRTRVIYRLEVGNRDLHDFDGDLDTSEPCGPPGTYYVRVDLTGDDITVLSSRVLTFTIEEAE